jgi:two-component system sensor histidine kinase UhpB
MQRADFSISLLVAVTLVVATTTILGILGVREYGQDRDRLTRLLKREHAMTVNELAVTLIAPLQSGETAQIDAVLISALQDNDVYCALVQSADPAVATRGRVRDDQWRPIATDHEPYLRGLMLLERPIQTTSTLAAASPRGGYLASLGSVKVFVTAHFLAQRLRQAAWSIVARIITVDTVLFMLLYGLLSYLVFRPLRALQEHAAASHARADLMPALPAGGFWGELARLKESLHVMIRLLHSRFTALQQSQERYELAVTGTNAGIWDWDLTTDEVYYSPQFRHLLGYGSVAEFPPTTESFWQHIHRDDMAHAKAATENHLAHRIPFDVEYRLITRAGEYRWFHGRGQAIWNAAGEPLRMAGAITDIHEQKRTELSLQAARDRELREREAFAQHLLLTQEQERQRIANELHDSVGQNLSLIGNRLQLALQINELTPAAREHLETLLRLTGETIAEVRAVAHNLRPLHIEQLGLTDALENLLKHVAESSGLDVQQRLDNVDDVLQGTAATHVYRIVQEAFNNIMKHAHATHARVELERDVHCLRLFIRDDGTGFNVGSRGNGLGLASIAERVRMLNGVLRIEARAGGGTAVHIELPVIESAPMLDQVVSSSHVRVGSHAVHRADP